MDINLYNFETDTFKSLSSLDKIIYKNNEKEKNSFKFLI